MIMRESEHKVMMKRLKKEVKSTPLMLREKRHKEMTESEKPVPFEDLQKALEQKAKTGDQITRDILVEAGKESKTIDEAFSKIAGIAKGSLYIPLEDVKQFLIDILLEKVIEPRKQLSELLQRMPNPKDEKYFAYDGQFRKFEFDPNLATWKSELKELLEASK